jgi:hypothetical protein
VNRNVSQAGEKSPPNPTYTRFTANNAAQEIETWVAALGRYDNNEFDEALGEFERIADTSKILFNIGVIHATLGEHEKAVCSPLTFCVAGTSWCVESLR